jgi:uncharacterized C2H2 Zn-finger protein
MKRYNKLVDRVDRYLMAGKNRQARVENVMPLFTTVIKIVLRDVIDSIKNGKCPYCGAKIKPKVYLVNHIKKSHYSRYYSDIKRAVDAYMKLVSLMVHSGNGWVIKENGVVLRGYKSDIAKKIEEDPSILRRLGVI